MSMTYPAYPKERLALSVEVRGQSRPSGSRYPRESGIRIHADLKAGRIADAVLARRL